MLSDKVKPACAHYERMLKDLTAAVLLLDLRGCEPFILSLFHSVSVKV